MVTISRVSGHSQRLAEGAGSRHALTPRMPEFLRQFRKLKVVSWSYCRSAMLEYACPMSTGSDSSSQRELALPSSTRRHSSACQLAISNRTEPRTCTRDLRSSSWCSYSLHMLAVTHPNSQSCPPRGSREPSNSRRHARMSWTVPTTRRETSQALEARPRRRSLCSPSTWQAPWRTMTGGSNSTTHPRKDESTGSSPGATFALDGADWKSSRPSKHAWQRGIPGDYMAIGVGAFGRLRGSR